MLPPSQATAGAPSGPASEPAPARRRSASRSLRHRRRPRETLRARTSDGRAAQRTPATNASRPLGQGVRAVPVHAVARPEAGVTVDGRDAMGLPALARPLHRLLRLGYRLDRHDPPQVAPQRSWRLKTL